MTYLLFYTASVSCSVSRHVSAVKVESHTGDPERTVSLYRRHLTNKLHYTLLPFVMKTSTMLEERAIQKNLTSFSRALY